MTFLPVVERELRVASRLRGTHWVRLTAALIALAIGGWIMIFPSLHNTPGALGAALFVSLSVLTNIYALLIGLLQTVDCLSEEKREGTLGLLFLTDLKGYDVVFGKLAATSLNTFYGMLAIFPVLAISLLVGGVSGGEFWRMVLVSVNNLLFSLTIGIFCSAISRDERKAMSLGLLLVLFFTGGLPLLGAIVREWGHTKELNPIFFILSPGYDFVMAFDANLNSGSGLQIFYPSVGVVHGVAWFFLLVSCAIVPRTWQDKALSGSSLRRRSAWEALVYGSTFTRAKLRLRLLAQNPFHWLTSRDRMKSWSVWSFLAVIGLFWAWGLACYPSDWKNPSAYCWTGVITHIVLKFWIAGEACRRFCLDRQSGALELLLSSPLSVRDILQGQLMSLRRQFAGPVVIVILSDLIFLASENEPDWTLYWVAWTTMLIADLITLSWVGMWMGLNSRNSTRAAGASIVRILFLPWLVFLALLTIMAVSSRFFSQFMPRGFDSKVLICVWMIFGFVNNVIFGLWAGRKLETQFRVMATRRFERRGIAIAVPVDPLPQAQLVQS